MALVQLQPSSPIQAQTVSKDATDASVEYLAFKLLNKRTRVRLSSETLELEHLPGKGSLFAVANQKGWFAAVTRTGEGEHIILSPLSELQSTFTEAAGDETLFQPQRKFPVKTARVTMITFARVDSRFCTGSNNGAVAVYDTAALFSPGTEEISPLHVFEPSSTGTLRQLAPNPGDATEQLAALREPAGGPGSTVVEVFDLQKLQVLSTWGCGPTPDTIPNTLTWSPKGKQLAFGMRNGNIVSFAPTSPDVPKSVIPRPPSAAHHNQSVISATWLSNPTFHAIYAPQGPLAPEAEQTHFVTSTDAKAGTVTDVKLTTPYMNFPGHRPPGAFIVVLRKWGQVEFIMVIGDSTSSDIGVVGTSKGLPDTWNNFSLDESGTPTLPLDQDMNDTVLLGLELDLTRSEPYKSNDASGQAVELPPPPILYAYCSDGTLQAWRIVNTEGGLYPDMVATAATTKNTLQPPVLQQTMSSLGAISRAPSESITMAEPLANPFFSDTSGSGFAQSASPATPMVQTPAFGSPVPASAFGQSTFGQSSAFGGASTFGAFGASGTSAFSQASTGQRAPTSSETMSADPAPATSGDAMVAETPATSGGFGGLSLGGDGSESKKASLFGAGTSGMFGVAATTPSGSNEAPKPASGFGQSGFGGGSVFKPAQAFGALGGVNQSSPFAQAAQGLKPASAFGQGGFGATGQGAFGQPSAFGAAAAKPATGFGAFGNAGQTQSNPSATTEAPKQGPAFGQSSFGSAPAFGQPAFGQSSFGQSSFGQSSFGQTAFGKPSFGGSGFGQPTTPGASSPSTTASTGTGGFSGFANAGTSAFGQAGKAGPSAPSGSGGGFAAFANNAPSGAASVPTAKEAQPVRSSADVQTPPIPAAPKQSEQAIQPPSTPAMPTTPQKPAPAPLAPTPATPETPQALPAATQATPAEGPPSTPVKNAFNAFGTASAFKSSSPGATGGAFGNLQTTPTAFSKLGSGFGAFGATTPSKDSPFFKASSPSPSTSAFGPATPTKAATSSPFGSPAGTPDGKSVFGKPSFGQSAFGQSAFSPISTTPVGSPAAVKAPASGGFGAFSGGSAGFSPAAGAKKSAFADILKGEGGASQEKKPTSPSVFASGSTSKDPPTTRDTKGKAPEPATPPDSDDEDEPSRSIPKDGSFSSLSSSYEEISAPSDEETEATAHEEEGSDPGSEEAHDDEDETESLSSDELSDEYPEEGEEEEDAEAVDSGEEDAEDEEDDMEEQHIPSTTPPLTPSHALSEAASKEPTTPPTTPPLARAASATPQSATPGVRVEPATPTKDAGDATKDAAQSTTPPGLPKEEQPVVAPASQPVVAPTPVPFNLGVNKPTTRPARSSPLANVASTSHEDDEDGEAKAAKDLPGAKVRPALPKAPSGSFKATTAPGKSEEKAPSKFPSLFSGIAETSKKAPAPPLPAASPSLFPAPATAPVKLEETAPSLFTGTKEATKRAPTPPFPTSSGASASGSAQPAPTPSLFGGKAFSILSPASSPPTTTPSAIGSAFGAFSKASPPPAAPIPAASTPAFPSLSRTSSGVSPGTTPSTTPPSVGIFGKPAPAAVPVPAPSPPVPAGFTLFGKPAATPAASPQLPGAPSVFGRPPGQAGTPGTPPTSGSAFGNSAFSRPPPAGTPSPFAAGPGAPTPSLFAPTPTSAPSPFTSSATPSLSIFAAAAGSTPSPFAPAAAAPSPFAPVAASSPLAFAPLATSTPPLPAAQTPSQGAYTGFATPGAKKDATAPAQPQPAPTPPKTTAMQAPTPPPAGKGMQMECEFQIRLLEKDLHDLGLYAHRALERKDRLGKGVVASRGTADLSNGAKWSLGDLALWADALAQLKTEINNLEDQQKGLIQSVRQLDSDMLKATTRKEEIARFDKARTDTGFAKMLKARSLGPEHLETQAQLRRDIRTMHDRIQKLEANLAASKRKVAAAKSGKAQIKAPSLDTINRTLRNIDMAIDQESTEVNFLTSRISKLNVDPDRLGAGSSRRSRLSVTPVQPARQVTPSVAASTASALNAERSAQKLKRALLTARAKPPLNTTASAAPTPPRQSETPVKSKSAPSKRSSLDGPSSEWDLPADDFHPGMSAGGSGSAGRRAKPPKSTLATRKNPAPTAPFVAPPPTGFNWGPLPTMQTPPRSSGGGLAFGLRTSATPSPGK